MMMQNSDDFFGDNKDMLSEYAAPVTDNGFSDGVLKSIEAQTRKVERIRRISIYGACFVGGIIAASQLPALVAMTAKIKLAAPSIPVTDSIPLSQWSWAGIILLGFVLWAALDRKASDIF